MRRISVLFFCMLAAVCGFTLFAGAAEECLHKYEYDISSLILPSDSESGSVTATCTVCGEQTTVDIQPNFCVASLTGGSAMQHGTIVVKLRLDANFGLWGANFEVGYDSDALVLTGIETYDGARGLTIGHSEFFENNPYCISISNNEGLYSDFTATGDIIGLVFRAVDTAPVGMYDVTLTAGEAVNSDLASIEFFAMGSRIEVTCGHLEKTLVTDTAPTCGEDGSGHKICDACGVLTDENVVIPATGEHTFSYSHDFAQHLQTCLVCGYKTEAQTHIYDENNLCVCGLVNPATVTFGDVNGDGYTNAVDASLLFSYSLSYINENEFNNPNGGAVALTASDVNGDGVVNSVDASMISSYGLSYISVFPAFLMINP